MLLDEVARAIAGFCPTKVDDRAACFAREVVARASPPTKARAQSLLYACSRLAAFGETVGLALAPEVLLHPSTIERYLATGASKLSPATARTVATNLRAVARVLSDEPRPARCRYPRERAKAPYSAAEIDRFLRLAAAQPTESRTMRATALICLCAGAGLTGADLRHVTGTDIVARSGGLLVRVSGTHPRAVPVLARFHEPLLRAARFAGEGFIVGGVDRARKNVTSGLVGSLAGGTDLAPLELRRLRSTWLASLARAIGLHAFMAAAGVDCSQRLGDIVGYLDHPEEQAVVMLLGGRC